MNESKDGGQAFPVLNSIQREEFDSSKGGYFQGVKSTAGMSLRDYFAAKAMQALAQDYMPDRVIPAGRYEGKTEKEIIGDRAYEIADTMLNARKA